MLFSYPIFLQLNFSRSEDAMRSTIAKLMQMRIIAMDALIFFPSGISMYIFVEIAVIYAI